jgi:TonB family protein
MGCSLHKRRAFGVSDEQGRGFGRGDRAGARIGATVGTASGRLNASVRPHSRRGFWLSIVLGFLPIVACLQPKSAPTAAPSSAMATPYRRPPQAEPTPTLGAVFHVGGAVEPPVLLTRVQPPERPVGHRGGGVAVVEAIIDQFGAVRDVRVLREPVLQPPYPEYTASVVAAIRQWRFKPATRNGAPVAVYLAITLTINWQ